MSIEDINKIAKASLADLIRGPMTINQTRTRDDSQSFHFKAETKQFLNILIHSLYKDREVFLRELLSMVSEHGSIVYASKWWLTTRMY